MSVIEKSEDFPSKRQKKISDSMAALGLDRTNAVALTDLQYANDDFETALGGDWKAKLDKERGDNPDDNNSLSNRLLRDHAKTICLGSVKEYGTWVIDYAATNIEHLGKAGKFEDLAALLSKPIKERIEFASSMGNYHGLHPGAVFISKVYKEVEEKLVKFGEKLEFGGGVISTLDEIVTSPFQSGLSQHAARVGALAVLAVAGIGIAAAFGPTIATALALKESPVGKIALGVGAATFALYKEYADPPKNLADYLKHKKQYEQVVPLSERMSEKFTEQRNQVEQDPLLSADEKMRQIAVCRGNCGSASIREVHSTLEKFYKLTGDREDISLPKKMGTKWSTKAMLKYQSFDDLQKLAEDFNSGLASNMPVDAAMSNAIQNRMKASPEFKQNVETRKERLIINVGKGALSVGAGLAVGGLFENKVAEMYGEVAVMGVAGVLSQKLPDPGVIAKKLHDKRAEILAKISPSKPSTAAFS